MDNTLYERNFYQWIQTTAEYLKQRQDEYRQMAECGILKPEERTPVNRRENYLNGSAPNLN